MGTRIGSGAGAGTLRVLALALLCGPVAIEVACAQAWVPARGSGSIQLGYKREVAKHHLDFRGERFSPGDITSESLVMTLEYGITDRLAVTASLPHVRKRYVGAAPHRPDLLEDGHDDHDHDHEHGIEKIDNGDYHGGWQDFGLKLRYNVRAEPFSITPFVALNYPTNDYVFFGHSAIGTHQQSLQLGVDVGRVFGAPFQNLYAQASYGYSFVEENDGVDVDRSNLTLELGYLFAPRVTGRLLLVGQKVHGGLDFPIDYPSRSDERFLHHDQTMRIDYVLGGAGLDYRLGEEWLVSGSWGKTLWGENGHEVHHVVLVALTRSF